jgi:signal transduction histidine kinase
LVIAAPIPTNEAKRLSALRRYHILDTAPEAAFDRVAELVAIWLDVPTALVSFVDAERQWFKARVGLDAVETPRDAAFCGYTILGDDCFIVADTHGDARFRDHPLVIGSPGIRFYAGAPLTSSTGLPLGSVCAIDTKPRQLSERDRAMLRLFAQIAADQLELHLATLKLGRELNERERLQRRNDELVATVSHELRTPLTAISGSLALVSRGAAGSLPEPATRLVEVALRNSERLVAIVNDILDTERLSSASVVFKREPIWLATLVTQSIESMRSFADRYEVAINLLPTPTTGVPAIGDDARTLQVIDNLLSNAIKFAPSGSNVEVTIEPAGNEMVVSVRDYGRGVPLEFQPRLFERFAMAEPAGQHVARSGLGLSIARAIVEGQGGRIGFVSPLPGGGSRFWFSLPTSAPRD